MIRRVKQKQYTTLLTTGYKFRRKVLPLPRLYDLWGQTIIERWHGSLAPNGWANVILHHLCRVSAKVRIVVGIGMSKQQHISCCISCDGRSERHTVLRDTLYPEIARVALAPSG